MITWQPNANVALVMWARKLLVGVEATDRTVRWVYVRIAQRMAVTIARTSLCSGGKATAPTAGCGREVARA